MARKFKIGQKVIFAKSRVPYEEDQGVMDRYIGTIGTVVDYLDDEYDYSVDFGSDRYSVRKDEIVKITKATKVLYGL